MMFRLLYTLPPLPVKFSWLSLFTLCPPATRCGRPGSLHALGFLIAWPCYFVASACSCVFYVCLVSFLMSASSLDTFQSPDRPFLYPSPGSLALDPPSQKFHSKFLATRTGLHKYLGTELYCLVSPFRHALTQGKFSYFLQS